MVRAVCFNKKAFTDEGFIGLLNQLKAEDGGTLTFTRPVNCVESFPNGTLCRSYAESDMLGTLSTAINCGEDIELFVYVNSYGTRNKPDYEDLVRMYQDGEMSIVDFIEAQEDLANEYHEYLAQSKRDRGEKSAGDYLDQKELTLTQEPPEELSGEEALVGFLLA